jgi:hypothetical protein
MRARACSRSTRFSTTPITLASEVECITVCARVRSSSSRASAYTRYSDVVAVAMRSLLSVW